MFKAKCLEMYFILIFFALFQFSTLTRGFFQIGQQSKKGATAQICCPRNDLQNKISLLNINASPTICMSLFSRRSFCEKNVAIASITTLLKPILVSAQPQQDLKAIAALTDNSNEQDILNLEIQALRLTAAGDFAPAEDAWTQVLKRNPASDVAWTSRGYCRLEQDKLDEALRDYDKAIGLNPSDPNTLMQRGMVLERLTNYEQALYDYASADNLVYMQNSKGNAAARYAAAVMLGKLGQWNDAKSIFREAAELDSSLLLAQAGEALALYQMGEDQQAVSRLVALTKSHPEFTDAFAALAGIYWEEKNLGLAETSWAKAQRGWTGQVARWPPRAVEALDNFLMIRFKSVEQ
mmetsp:Transcript_22865/g.29668  ORF Transcript_22865/g.29668 Transcript_22865/m.29668 type:complete len:351 (-) Transcript_22865:471-1523(-)